MLAAQWKHRLPFIQSASPAELAAAVISRAIEDLEIPENAELTVIDFCSGGGGKSHLLQKLSSRVDYLLPRVPMLCMAS